MPGQDWGTDGGFIARPELSKKLRHIAQPQMKADQFTVKENAFGKNRGDTFFFSRAGNVATAGGQLVETQTIPVTKVPLSQGSISVTEYGNSISFTGKVEALSEIDVERIILQPLKNDAAKVLNSAAMTQFKATYVQYTPTGTDAAPTGAWDTDGTISTAATRHIQAEDVYNIVEYMTGTLFVPPYSGNDYVALCHTSFLRMLRADPDWQEVANYAYSGTRDNPQYRGYYDEVGRLHGVRFVMDNQALAAVLGTTIYKGEAIFFGEDAVMKAVAVPLEVREKTPADFGRDKGMAWYFLGGYKIIFDLTAAAGFARIVRVNST